MHRTQTGTDIEFCAQNTEKHGEYVLCTGTGTGLDTDSVHRDRLLCTGHGYRALCTGNRGTTQDSVHRTGHRLLCTDTEHRTQASVHRHRTQNTGFCAQDTDTDTDTERRAQNAEHRTQAQNTGHRAQNTGHRTQDTEHRTQNTGTDIEILI